MVRIGNNGLEKGARVVRYCSKCLTPDSRPRIVFDDKGVCNACRHNEVKHDGIDWAAREKEFLKILDTHRRKDGGWDCIVPWSGGKDSSSIAYKLKYEFGMNPLLVTNSPMIINEVGEHNREALLRAGFDMVFVRPNQKAQRILAKRFFIERGNPKVVWEAGKEAVPVRASVNHRIPLVFYAEHGESEYGGKVLRPDADKVKDYSEVVENIVGDDARNWTGGGVTRGDLNHYIYPTTDEIRGTGTIAYYFAHFFKWSMYENYEYIKDKIDFRTCLEGRTQGTFTDFDSLDDLMDDLYYYMQYIKFGFGRAVRDASRMIQNGHMTREEGLELARKYDHEFPERNLDRVLEYLDLTRQEFINIVDRHRNPEIWDREGNEWVLRYPLPRN